MYVRSNATLWNVVSSTGQSLQLAACHYRKQPHGIQLAMNLERDSYWETSAIENSGHQGHANQWITATVQHASVQSDHHPSSGEAGVFKGRF